MPSQRIARLRTTRGPLCIHAAGTASAAGDVSMLARMPCLIFLMALFVPRLAIVLVWLFSGYLERAYDSALLGLLGFLFMPYTLLAYAWAWHHGGLHGVWVLPFAVAIVVDVGHWGMWRRRRR